MYNLRSVVKEDLDYILECRNRPEIRKNMYTSQVIKREEHYSYFEKVFHDKTKMYLICEDEDCLPVGVVNFVDINTVNKTASWAFYSSDIKRRGVGTWMEYLALNYAFETLGLHKLNCEVLDFNYKVIEFHLKFGFRVEGIFKKLYYTQDSFADVYRLSIFDKDWLKYQKPFFSNLLSGYESNDKLKVGDSYEETFMFSQDDIRQFAETTGDLNPIYLRDTFAQEMGFKKTICHGAMINAVFSRILGTRFPGDGTVCLQNKLSFFKPVYHGCNHTARLKVVRKVGRKVTLETLVVNEGEDILLRGEADVLVPK